MSILNKVINKVFGKKSDKDLKKIQPIINQINEEYIKFEKLKDEELKNIFFDIKSNLASIIQEHKSNNPNSDLENELKKIENYYVNREKEIEIQIDNFIRCIWVRVVKITQ